MKSIHIHGCFCIISLMTCLDPSTLYNIQCAFDWSITAFSGTLFLMWTASFQVPTILDKQGAQLLAVAFLVVSRTWVSDRIASLNGIFSYDYSIFWKLMCKLLKWKIVLSGTTVKFVLEQDKASFIRLIGLSVLQSAASAFIAPSIRLLLQVHLGLQFLVSSTSD